MRHKLFLAGFILLAAGAVTPLAIGTPQQGGAAATTAPASAQAPGRGGGGGGGRGRGAANYPAAVEADFNIKDFKFRSGETLDLRLHYRTIGTLRKDAAGNATNAVLVTHGTTGTGTQFTVASFGGELFGPGQLLDAQKYFIVLTDAIGHGKSSKPSDGLKAKFPKYGYEDMVVAQYRVLTEGLGINHMRLIMGTSMGGMHTWLWGERYPDYMDALMPLAAVPTPISGRNRMWRRIVIDSITEDPEWKGGDYAAQPRGLKIAMEMMYLVADNPAHRVQQFPTLEAADRALENDAASAVRSHDANDVLYAFRASEDYNPWPDLEKIKAPIIAVNSADDLINPPDIHSLEEGIARVKSGKLAQAVVLPETPQTRGHGTHTMASQWKQYLEKLLKESEK